MRPTPEQAQEKILESRVNTLERISGLKVRSGVKMVKAKRDGKDYRPEYWFSFEHLGGDTLKTIFTYRKARVFAEGYAIGVQYGSAPVIG